MELDELSSCLDGKPEAMQEIDHFNCLNKDSEYFYYQSLHSSYTNLEFLYLTLGRYFMLRMTPLAFQRHFYSCTAPASSYSRGDGSLITNFLRE